MANRFRKLLRRVLTPFGLMLLDLRNRFGPTIGVSGDAKCVAVVASYARPQNIQRLVNTFLRCSFVSEIVISNHNPDIRIEDFVAERCERVRLLNSTERQLCGHRFRVANKFTGDYYIVLDDDIFMFPEQVRSLFRHLLRNPGMPHGFHGSKFLVLKDKENSFKKVHVARKHACVDVLHQGYAITRKHLEQMLRIRAQLNEIRVIGDEDPTDVADDIVVSFSGSERAFVHDVAPILTCPTSLEPSIAVCGQDGFSNKRDKIFAELSKQSGRPPEVAVI